MIRFICIVIFVILFLVLSIPLLIAEWIIGKFNPDFKSTSSLAIVNWAFGVCLWFAGTQITYLGEDRVPKNEAVLYIGNHRSYFDILMTYVRVPRPTGYIAKKEMLRYPLLVNWMKNLHCLFLDRKDLKQGMKTIVTAIEKVKSGISICIFPEGTRSKGGPMIDFKPGSMKLATKPKVPIIPVSIEGSYKIFEERGIISPGTVKVMFHPAISTDDLPKDSEKHLNDKVHDIIKSGVEELRNQ